MSLQVKQGMACENSNHRRANAPVPHCLQGGGVVNASLRRAARCDDAQRTFAVYGIQCGMQLIAPLR